jgi:hypothetical protein
VGSVGWGDVPEEGRWPEGSAGYSGRGQKPVELRRAHAAVLGQEEKLRVGPCGWSQDGEEGEVGMGGRAGGQASGQTLVLLS